MKRSVPVAIAVAVVCGAIPWQSSLNSQELAKQPTPAPPPFQLAKSVTIDALSNEKHNNTDYVMVKYQLKVMQADIFAPNIEKMMSPLGHVIPLENANQLMLIDTVANVREVVTVIQKIDMDGSPGGPGSLAHKCLNVRASVAAEKLKEILNNPNAVAPANPGLPQPAGKIARQIKPHTVGYDDRTNIVFVNGPPDKVNLAKQALAKLDVLDKQGQQRREKGLELKIHIVPTGLAESSAKMLEQMYPFSSAMRVKSVGATQIMVYAPAADQAIIAKLLDGAQPPQGVVGVFALMKSSDANKIADLVLHKLSNDPGPPLVKADTNNNAIIVVGSPNQVEAVRLMIESFSGEKSQGPQGK